jgi:4'-phosphopantetheinyl transferase
MADWTSDHFAASSRALTPAPVRHAVQLLYVPVSPDPEVTKRCASVLSDTELQRAGRFAAPGAEALFKQRRAFRRFCGALALGSSQPLAQITFKKTQNGRPYLAELPDCWFSFSSCRFGFVGAWSSSHAIGVDLEDQTKDPEAVKLARRFFSAAEASAVERADGSEHLRIFFQFWSLKEAALKSIGEGLPFGLDAFEFELAPDLRVIHAPSEHGGPERFNAHVVEGTAACATLVIRSLA